MSEFTYREALRQFSTGRFSPCYLIYGEEPFFVDQTLRGLRPNEADAWNYEVRDGRQASPEEVVALAKSCPLMGASRVVVLHNADKISDPKERLIAYIKAPLETAVMVFIASKPDMRTKLFVALKQQATLIACPPLYDNEVPRFIREEANRQHLSLSEETIWHLKERLGNDLYRIHHELKKMAVLTGIVNEPRPLGAGAPAVLSSTMSPIPTRVYSVFELISAVEVKDTSKGLYVLSALLTAGEAPLMILAMLMRQFRMMAIAKEQLESMPESAVRKGIALPPSRVGPFLQALRLWTCEEVRAAFNRFYAVDDHLKRGGVGFVVMEQLILGLCHPPP